MGIEPTRPAWKAGILPLNYTRKDVRSHVLEYYITHIPFCQYFFLKNIFDFCKTRLNTFPLTFPSFYAKMNAGSKDA